MRRRPTIAGPRSARRHGLVLALPAALLLVGAMLAGCAQPTAGVGAVGSSVPTTTSAGLSTQDTGGSTTATASTTSPTTSTCSPAPAMHTAGPVGDDEESWDEPILTVSWTTNGWGAEQVSGPTTITIYPDGRVLAFSGSGTSSSPLARVLRGEFDDCRLAALVTAADELMGLDFGAPAITDQGMTLVSYRTRDGVESSLSVYALGIGDQYVTQDQRSAREELHRWLAGVRAAGEAARQEYRPSRLMLRVVDTDSDTIRALTWPGSLGSLGAEDGPKCVNIGGDDAVAVRRALGDGPALARWSDGTGSVVLRAFVALPGADLCH